VLRPVTRWQAAPTLAPGRGPLGFREGERGTGRGAWPEKPSRSAEPVGRGSDGAHFQCAPDQPPRRRGVRQRDPGRKSRRGLGRGLDGGRGATARDPLLPPSPSPERGGDADGLRRILVVGPLLRSSSPGGGSPYGRHPPSTAEGVEGGGRAGARSRLGGRRGLAPLHDDAEDRRESMEVSGRADLPNLAVAEHAAADSPCVHAVAVVGGKGLEGRALSAARQEGHGCHRVRRPKPIPP